MGARVLNQNYYFFEEDEYDIPFYRKTPRLTRNNLIILLIGFIIAVAAQFIIIEGQQVILKACIITLATLIPVVYTMRGNLKPIFRIPKARDILTIIFGFLVYMALSILISSTLLALGVPSPTNNAVVTDTTIASISMIIQILGEELLKFIAFVITMYYAYKKYDRKNSIIIALIVSQLLFAVFHIPAYGLNIPHLLLSIALVSSVLPVIYLRTKNITVTYLTHLLIDLVPTLLVLMIPTSLLLI